MQSEEVIYQNCVEPAFWRLQAIHYQHALEQHKYYMSQKVGHDVGWDVATADFNTNYMMGFAVGFRIAYCGLVCPRRCLCAIGQTYIIISSE